MVDHGQRDHATWAASATARKTKRRYFVELQARPSGVGYYDAKRQGRVWRAVWPKLFRTGDAAEQFMRCCFTFDNVKVPAGYRRPTASVNSCLVGVSDG